VKAITPIEYQLMLPMVELTIFAIGILLIDLMIPREWKWLNAMGAFIGILLATFCVWRIQVTMPRGSIGFYNSLLVDRFAMYFWYLFLASAAITILASVRYLEIENEHHGEYYSLILFSVVGMMCMAAGIDIVLLFIGLELMALSIYVLVGFLRRDRRSNEAALKYLLLGAFSSGIFAYGLSLLYGLSGSTNLGTIQRAVASISARDPHNPILIIALLTVTVGLLFEIAAVPFHQWAPDAYEGAPTSITGFMSVAVKAAAWALLLRILVFGLLPLRSLYTPIMVFVAIATMTGGNLAALTQTNTKRLLAYSSIAHVGYMLLAFVAMGTSPLASPAFADGFKGILIYLMVYTFMNLGVFAVITSLRHRNVIGDELDDLAGLYSRAPFEAVLMLLFLLSLAGIPPAAGFLGKYYIFLSLIESQHYWLASAAVLYALFGLYYYLRIANAMLIRPAPEGEPARMPVGIGMRFALGLSGLMTIVIGVFPEPFIRTVNWSLGIAQPHVTAMMR
jgi:NADH-quinone oxidoreductase subunit N